MNCFMNLNELVRTREAEERQEAIVPILRTHLPRLETLSEEEGEMVLSLWLECLEEGMDCNDLLTLVAAQSLLQDRTLTMEQLPEPLLSPRIIRHSLVPFWRIYLHILLKAVWARRRQLDKEAARTIYPDSRQAAGFEEALSHLVKFLLEEAVVCAGTARRLVITLVHQLYLEAPSLIPKTCPHVPRDLVPWIVEYAPSTRTPRPLGPADSVDVLIDRLIVEIPLMETLDASRLNLAVHLATKYPLPKTLNLCLAILERLQAFAALTVEQAIASLELCILCLRAFPAVMSQVSPLLAKWAAAFGSDPQFTAATVAAASQITQLTAAVNAPIYHRPVSLNSRANTAD